MESNSGIYGLIDPRTDVVMYVGKAVNIARRYRQHCDLVNLSSHGDNVAKYRWAHELAKEGLRPRLKLLRAVSPSAFEEMNSAEQEIIRAMKAIGQAEFNIAVGGNTRSARVAQNGHQDDWMELGDLLRKIDSDIFEASNLAGRLAGAKYCDKVSKASRLINAARIDLEDLIVDTFPEWRDFARTFYKGNA